jgi:hypothetical protein
MCETELRDRPTLSIALGQADHAAWLELTKLLIEYEDGYELAGDFAKKLMLRFWSGFEARRPTLRG